MIDERWGNGAWKVLTGHTVREMYMEKGGQRLVFRTDEGLLAYGTSGDCCSDSWFADIIGVDNLLGSEIRHVDTLDLPDPDDNRSRQECDRAYGIKFTTDRGVTDIIYRNSSNGYYGGESYRSDDVSIDDTVRITADWQA